MARSPGSYRHLSVADRLAQQSIRNDATGCLEWVGYRTNGGHGYGLIRDGGRRIGSHVAAYELAHGTRAVGMLVCHRCDNPACIEPRHLFIGTQRDNALDAASKGRMHRPSGELNANAKLSTDDVVEIRASNARGVDLALQFGVSKSTITNIRRRQRWSHLGA
jgi:hypothetical protein